jgi:alpha-L-fucosidase
MEYRSNPATFDWLKGGDLMQRRYLLLTLLFSVVLSPLNALSQAGTPPFAPQWESLDQRKTPSWFTDGKFGIFIHWGVYSVPAWGPPGQYAEWYWNAMTQGKNNTEEKEKATWNFHVKTYGANFDYKEFAPMFRAELFDPIHWADVFARSGAKYIVLTSKHHEGFCLWKNEQANLSWGRPWNSVEVGPKRDLLGDLTEAVRRTGLRMGIYYSLYEWYNPLWLADKKRFVDEHMFPQFKDVVTRYKPSIIFSDGEWDLPSSEWKSEKLLAWLFNESPVREEVVINDRWGKDCRHKHGGYYTTEYGAGMRDAAHPWEESRGMGFSYGYNRAETLEHYRTDEELLLNLVDLVSKGGNLLLDIGPTADGRIPVIMEERLIQIGNWLKVNGEAIYATHPWRNATQWSEGRIQEEKYGEFMTGYDINKKVHPTEPGMAHVEAFFTAKAENLYVIFSHWTGKTFALKGVKPSSNTTVSLLGYSKPIKWKIAGNDLLIELPDSFEWNLPRQLAYTLKLTQVQ